MSNKLRLLKKGFINKGFSLVEVMVGLMILAIAIVSILTVMLKSMILNEGNRNLSRAVNHAQFVLEEMRDFAKNNNLNNLNATVAGNIWDTPNFDMGLAGWNVLDNEGVNSQAGWEDAAQDLLNVTVTISWDDSNRPNRSTNLITFIANEDW